MKLSAHDTLKRDGGWTVELIHPLIEGGNTIEAINISAPELNHTVAWLNQQIPSTLALLEQLSGVPEAMLRRLHYPDADRVLMALAAVMPAAVKVDFQNGTRPLITPPPQPTAPPTNEDPLYPGEEQLIYAQPPSRPAAAPGVRVVGTPPPGIETVGENDPNDPRFPRHSEVSAPPPKQQPKPTISGGTEDNMLNIDPAQQPVERVGT